ncbi:MAG: DUF2877 domain-containing protein [Candidatus Hodarchaeota archaeon]
MGSFAAQHLHKNTRIGNVYSIHKQAINIETDNGMLIGIIDSSFGNYIANIRVNFPISFNLTNFIHQKTDVFHENNKIKFISSPLEISLLNTEVWNPQIDLSFFKFRFSLKKRLNECKKELLQYSRSQLNFLLNDQSPPNQWCRSGSRAYEKLKEGIVSYNAKLCLETLKRIIGLGPGWTPSWDDFLAGFFASLYLIKCQNQETNPLYNLLQHIKEDKHLFWSRTTPQSFQQIQFGLKGHLPEEHLLILNQLFHGGPKSLASFLTRIFNIGHTSGADLLVGLLEGLHFVLTNFNKRK